MADELIDICDDSNNLLNIQEYKSVAHRDGLWHRTVHIWIYNSKLEILLQLRSKNKLLYPDFWDISAAGHVSAGEDPIVSGIRELEEELGIVVQPDDLQFSHIRKDKGIYKQIKNYEFYYIYFLKYDGDIGSLKLQEEEVQQIKFFTIPEILSELHNNSDKYTNHDDYWIEVIDEVQKLLK